MTVARRREMALIATGSNKEFKKVPEGNHTARCYRIIDLGTQSGEYMGEPKLTHKVLIGWELHGEADDGTPLKADNGEPMTISKQYTLSLGKKANLRADLESWRGKAFTDDELKGFDITALLGAYCMVTVKHDTKGEKTYTNVASVSRWPAALKNAKPAAVLENHMFDVNAPDMQQFESFPDWLKEKISGCMEWGKKPAQTVTNAKGGNPSGFDDMDDDIPF
jgi:hypothetical protein